VRCSAVEREGMDRRQRLAARCGHPCGMWHVACGMWHVACGMWHVACGMWHVACAFGSICRAACVPADYWPCWLLYCQSVCALHSQLRCYPAPLVMPARPALSRVCTPSCMQSQGLDTTLLQDKSAQVTLLVPIDSGGA